MVAQYLRYCFLMENEILHGLGYNFEWDLKIFTSITRMKAFTVFFVSTKKSPSTPLNKLKYLFQLLDMIEVNMICSKHCPIF